MLEDKGYLHCSFLATAKTSASFISRLASHWQHRPIFGLSAQKVYSKNCNDLYIVTFNQSLGMAGCHSKNNDKTFYIFTATKIQKNYFRK